MSTWVVVLVLFVVFLIAFVIWIAIPPTWRTEEDSGDKPLDIMFRSRR